MTTDQDSTGLLDHSEDHGVLVRGFRPEDFLHLDFGVIGRTVSTKNEPNTSSEFNFWVHDVPDLHGRIEIGNIVAAQSDSEDDVTFGVVTKMRAYSDVDSFIADYLSHDFGSAAITVPTDISEVTVVTCAVMRNLSLKTKPVARSRVYFPSREGIQFAYGIIDRTGESIFAGAPIPVGLFENGDGTAARISVDEHFLVGPEGAHLNVSGISGLAAKTSAGQFIIKSLLTHKQKRIAVVFFNVKAKDLLYLDQPNPRIENDEWSGSAYVALGIPPEPFTGARFFAPGHPNRPNEARSLRVLPTTQFRWDLQQIYRDIPSLFSSFDWDDRMEGVWFTIQERIESQNILTYSQMVNWINDQIRHAGSNQQYILGNHIATWNKMRSHLVRFPRAYAGLLATAGTGVDIPWSELQDLSVFVIDIQALNDRGQRLVFSRSIRAINDLLEGGTADIDAVVVFVDELNKFAPSGSERSPLKANLIDITARGRSVGLVLFGAEQFASSVDREIVENSSTYLFGRTEASELRSPSYGSLSDELKTKLMMLPQGELLVKFAKFPQPLSLSHKPPSCGVGKAVSS